MTIRRLNRTDYQNAVHDLLDVEYNTLDVFPPDDTGYGFDKIGDVLSISPLLMEKYINASDEVVNIALPKGEGARLPRMEIDGKNFVSTSNPKVTGRWLPLSTPAEVSLQYQVPWPGTYQVSLGYSIRGATEATEHEARMKLLAGGTPTEEIGLDWDQRRIIETSQEVVLKKGSKPSKWRSPRAGPLRKARRNWHSHCND